MYKTDLGVTIHADNVEIASTATIDPSAQIYVEGTFKLGAYSKLGSCNIKGNNVIIGEHFYSTDGLNIGGGGCNSDEANLTVGDRCTFHNNFINIAKPVIIGNDVGLSPEVSILTHGFWLSVLEGYPARFEGVKIGNGVIVGYRSLINAGVEICDNAVIGSQANATKSIDKKGIYGGNPAKFIKEIIKEIYPFTTLQDIINKYKVHSGFGEMSPLIEYPIIQFAGWRCNVESFEYEGIESKYTDDFRDYLRRYGIRIYTKRPFKSL